MMWTSPAELALNELGTAPVVRFSVLALSSIFFLVDPLAAIPSFLAITENADVQRRKRMARKGALTCFIVLTIFAVGGQLIFRLFGITLPAFEIAGGVILLLIGLDMLQARRSATQEASGDTEEGAAKEDAGIVPLGIPMLAGAGRVLKVLGETGIRVLVRVMGLLLVALAMQYFVNGLKDLGLIARLEGRVSHNNGGFPQDGHIAIARTGCYS
jgi:multiple antibiotic resistance protein